MRKGALFFLFLLCQQLTGQIVRNGDMERLTPGCRIPEWQIVSSNYHMLDKRHQDKRSCSSISSANPQYVNLMDNIPSGNNAVGINPHYGNEGESIGQRLSTKLEKGKTYNLSFYAAYHVDRNASERPLPFRTPSIRFALSSYKPAVVGNSHITDVYFTRENQWERFSYCITIVDDSLDYLSFSTINNVIIPNPGILNPTIGFFIDDVRIDSVFSESIDLQDTILCKGEVIDYDLSSYSHLSFLWVSDSLNQGTSNGPTLSINKSGTYFAFMSNSCFSKIDTIEVRTPPEIPKHVLGNDTVLCRPNQLTIDLNYRDVLYSWRNGSTASNLTIDKTGVYGIDITDYCGVNTKDTLKVTVMSAPTLDLGEDRTLCKNDVLSFAFPFDEEANYLWQDSSKNNLYAIRKAGKYWVQKNNQCGTVTDTLLVSNGYIPAIIRVDSSRFYSILSVENKVFDQYQWIFCDSLSLEGASYDQLKVEASGLYSLATKNGSCLDTSACFNIRIQDKNPVELLIYPNPTNELVNIEWNEEHESIDIIVYDEHGRLIRELTYHSVDHVKLNLFETMGLYFIGIRTDNMPRKFYRVVKAW